DLEAVLQNILAVTGAETQSSEKLTQFLMEVADVGFHHCLFADFENVPVHLVLSFLDHFFDARRVNSTVLDKFGQGKPGSFAADVVKGTHNDNAGSVVNNDIHACRFFEGADVAAFAADDAALHIVAGDVYGADGAVGGVSRRVALNGGDDDFAGFL